MKNVKRLSKPDSLVKNAENWKKAVLDAKGKGKVPPKLLEHYKQPDVLDALKKMYSDQDGVCYCCYCEAPIEPVSYPAIEHRKPKSKFPEYAFDWENLHLVCETCNTKKGNKWDEQNPILDAVSDKPIKKHLTYRFDPVSGIFRYTLTDRGVTTSNHADLNRPSLRKARLTAFAYAQLLIKEIKANPDNPKAYTVMQILKDKCSREHGSLVEWLLEQELPKGKSGSRAK